MVNNNNFNLNEFMNGKTATTKLGNLVRFITALPDGKILVEVHPRSRIVEYKTLKYSVPTSQTYTAKYYANGKKYRNYDCDYDLVMEKPKPLRDPKTGRFIKRS